MADAETSTITVESGGVEIVADVAGNGPTVLLVHGWPDDARLWRHQIAALTDAGYRTVALDLRGFGRSGRPDVAECSIPHHVGDLLAILDAVEVERAHVVGHDWGAALAWSLGAFVPDRVDHLATLSVGHPSAFASVGFAQREKSWYMLLFQFTGVAEQWLSDDDFANFRAWSNHPRADEVAATLADPADLAATLAIYRANVPPESLLGPALALPGVIAPTMGIWSSDDMALTEEQMTGSAAYVSGTWRYERIDSIGHWIPLAAPDRVNELLVDFLPSPS